MRIAAAFIALAALGCGSGANFNGSCPAVTLGQCTDLFDLTGDEAQSQKLQCQQSGYTWSATACNRTGSFGGCKLPIGHGYFINWFFAGSPASSPAQVMTACNGNPYVAP